MITSMCNSYEHTIVITNRHLVQGDFLKQLEKVTKLHPHALILREKDLTDDAYESLAKKVFDLCKREDITFFLHTKIEIARKIGCQNIHLSIPVLRPNASATSTIRTLSCSMLIPSFPNLVITWYNRNIIFSKVKRVTRDKICSYFL